MVRRTVARVVAAGVGTLAVIASACGGGSPSKPSPVPEPLTVKSVTPNAGPTEGRLTVSITGTGFQQGLTVNLDGPATNILVSGTTVISATVPAHAEGTVDLIVTNPDGQSARLEKAYTYAPISVTKIQPAAGTIGRWVRIDGFGFLLESTVTFDGTAATRVVTQGGTSIFAVAPAHAPGVVDMNRDESRRSRRDNRGRVHLLLRDIDRDSSRRRRWRSIARKLGFSGVLDIGLDRPLQGWKPEHGIHLVRVREPWVGEPDAYRATTARAV
jgi:IPT/TIG domain